MMGIWTLLCLVHVGSLAEWQQGVCPTALYYVSSQAKRLDKRVQVPDCHAQIHTTQSIWHVQDIHTSAWQTMSMLEVNRTAR